MKKFKVIITLIVFLLILTPTALARPGGGGGGSSGGGSSSGGSSGYSSSRYYGNSRYSRNPVSNAISTIVSFGVFTLVLFGKNISQTYVVRKQHSHCKKQLRALSKSDEKWKLHDINRDIHDAFYAMSEAWTKMDQDIAITHCTEKLYNNHQSKLQWMQIRNEVNIIKSPRLLSNKVVLVKDNLGDEDTLIVYIKASMIDYIETDGYVTSGSRHKRTSYVEYWKFDYINGTWMLDEIIQPEDYIV